MKDRQDRLLRSLEAFQAHQGLKTIQLTSDQSGNYMVSTRSTEAQESLGIDSEGTYQVQDEQIPDNENT